MSRPTPNDKQIIDRSASMHLYICTLIISSQRCLSVFKQLCISWGQQHPDKTDTTAHLHLLLIQQSLIWTLMCLRIQFQKGSIKGGQEKSDTFSWTQT